MKRNAQLEQQLKELGLSAASPPADASAWSALLKRVSESYGHKDSLIHSTLDYLFTVDEQGTISYCNRPFDGIEPAAMVGRNIFSLFKIRTYRLRRAVEFAFGGQTHESDEVIYTSSDGRNSFFSIRSGPLKQGKKVTLALICATDTTEQRNLRELAESGRNLQIHSAKMIALGEMAGGIAHEINTPLSSLKLLSEQIGEMIQDPTPDTAVIQSHASKITFVVDRIAQIVRGLRTFARDGEREPFAPIDIGELIVSTLSFCRERFATNGVRLEFDAGPGDLKCMGRFVQLSQILLNLLNNAFDAVETSQEKWVRVRASAQDSILEISVTDSGPGMPEEIREKIFQPFFTTKEIGKGTGMGLSISKSIVEEHGGSIRLDTSTERTRFIMQLNRLVSRADAA